ncbi:MAG TPA: hypothetical protein VKM00_00030, partial [Luteimonas sp.]|nr:hypothetical protein [Luteimonas sp.]
GWTETWLRDLRDYPHRCWEQTLSRAVGAALALDADPKQSLWPNAHEEVQQALTVAPAFQDEQGDFRFFLNRNYDWTNAANPVLSAYTLRSFTLLHALGYQIPEAMQDSLIGAVKVTLATVAKPPTGKDDNDWRWETAATSAGALSDPKDLDSAALRNLWQAWPRLSWYARSELLRALARKPEFAEQTREAVQRLREAGEAHGLRRVIHDKRDHSYALGSPLRDQCAVVGTLFEFDHDPDGAPARASLLRGLQDLFAGGTASLDTQSSAQCLMALHVVKGAIPTGSQAQQIRLALGTATVTLSIPSGHEVAHWQPELSLSSVHGNALRLQSASDSDPTLNFTARLSYRIDLEQARAQAIGMRLERSYQVLRNGEWLEQPKTPLREGDWVRVRLRLDVPALRRYVAITDIVPGGLVTRDINLSGVGGVGLKHLGDPGSWWFESRQTGANQVQLYAEQLPPGEHEVFYYAQAVQPGDYLAPPAVAELMYGRASRATTESTRILIEAKPAAGKH